MKKASILFSLLLLSISFGGPVSAEEVKIGFVADLSGKNAFHGEQEVVASKLAIEDLEKEDIELEVIFEDSQLNPMQGLSAVQKLINVDKVDVLFVDFSPIINATLDTIMKANKLVLYSAAARSPLKKYDYAFKTYMDYVDACTELGAVLKGMHRKVGYMKIENEAAELCQEGFKVSLKDEFLTQDFPAGMQPKTQILNLKKKGYDAVVVAGYPQETIELIKAANAIAFKPIFAESDYALNPAVRSEFKSALENSLVYGIKSNRPVDYDKRHSALLKDPSKGVLPYAAMDYVHLKQLARAVSACAKGDMDCQKKELSEAKPEPEFGFLGWQDRRAKVDISVRKIVNGEVVER